MPKTYEVLVEAVKPSRWPKILAALVLISLVLIFGTFIFGNGAQQNQPQKQNQLQNMTDQWLQEAEWAMANPDKAFTITKDGPTSWTITNNLHMTVGSMVGDVQGCKFDHVIAIAGSTPGIYYVVLLDPGQSATLTCPSSDAVIRLRSVGIPWTEVGQFCLGKPDFKC
jgi:hypothetical protein